MAKKSAAARKSRAHGWDERHRAALEQQAMILASRAARSADSDSKLKFLVDFQPDEVVVYVRKWVQPEHALSEQQTELFRSVLSTPAYEGLLDAGIEIRISWDEQDRTVISRLAEITKELQESLVILSEHPKCQEAHLTSPLGYRLSASRSSSAERSAARSPKLDQHSTIRGKRLQADAVPYVVASSEESCSSIADQLKPTAAETNRLVMPKKIWLKVERCWSPE